MNDDHEPILAALLVHLEKKAPGFQTYSRRLKFWQDTPIQPALFLRRTANEDAFLNNIISRTTIEAEIWLYSRAGQDPKVAPDTALNQLAKSVRLAFAPDDPRGVFTLGGLAFWCRIEGRSEYDSGDIDAQSKAVLPVLITLP